MASLSSFCPIQQIPGVGLLTFHWTPLSPNEIHSRWRNREHENLVSDALSTFKLMDSLSEKEGDHDSDESITENTENSEKTKENNVSTTLEDLPVELLEMILMKTISKAIILKNLPRSARDENVCQTIMELRTVWSEWDYRFTTKWFKIMFRRQLKRLGSVDYKTDPVLIHTIKPMFSMSTFGSVFRGLAIIDDELFIVRMGSLNMDVYDSRYYTFRRFLSVTDLSFTCTIPYPRNICNEGVVSCQTNKCLYIVDQMMTGKRSEPGILRVDINGKVLKHWSTGYHHAQVQLSITKESNVLVAVQRVGQLIEYSPDGQVIQQITLNVGVWYTPVAVKLENGQLVVISGSHQSLCLVDVNGDVLKVFSRGKTFSPQYLAVDGEGSILVYDQGKRAVFVYNSNFIFQKEILTQEKYIIGTKALLDERNGRLLLANASHGRYYGAKCNKFPEVSILNIR